MRKLLMLLMLGVLVTPSSWAHDPSKHKGRQTPGEIVSSSADRLEIKTAKGNQVVLLTSNPKIEKGDKPGSTADLRKGQTITVIGTTLASGEIVAKEILLPVSTSTKTQPGHAGHPH